MAEENMSPDDDLLKFVDDSQEQDLSASVSTAGSPETKASKGFLGFNFFKSSKEKTEGKDKGSNAVLDIKVWNRVLVALVLAAGVYLVLDLVIFRFDGSKFLSHVGTNDAVYPIVEEEQVKKGLELEYYISPIEKRNPFMSPSAISEERELDDAIEMISAQTDRMAEILDGMKLVGISWADEPLAMIEDVESGRTYFARKGQVVRGVKVESITKDKVTLTYEGEEGFLI